MSQLVKCLSCKRKALILGAPKSGDVSWASNPSLGSGHRKMPGGCWRATRAKLVSSRFSKRVYVSAKTKWKVIKGDSHVDF